jgi:hypothetical protein
MASDLTTYAKNLEAALKLDSFFRSQIIYIATAIEGVVGEAIAWHFCPDEEKHLLFMALLFQRAEVPFSKKIDIIEYLLKNNYSDLNQDYAGIINKLNSVRRLRNKFAHSELVLDEERLKEVDKGVYLRYLNRDGVVVEELLSTEETNKRLEEARDLRWFVIYLLEEIKNRATGKEHNQFKPLLEELKKLYPNVLTG